MNPTDTLTRSKPLSFDGSGGRGRRARKTPKGRQIDTTALEEIQGLLTDRPRRRDLLIEHLHLIQDKYGHLSAAHLTALAFEMKMALAEVYEVATFYAHFDVVKDGETPPPAVTVRVCDSLSCAMAGADSLLSDLQAKYGNDVRVIRAPCMGACDVAPVVAVGHVQTFRADAAKVEQAVKAHEHAHAATPGKSFDIYRSEGGYALLKSCVSMALRTREDMIKAVDNLGLRGLGGAGFPTGRKWTFVRAEKGPRLMAVNGDEGEPGTFKDRYYLGLDPHRFIEGMLIAAWWSRPGMFISYLRDEYPELRLMLLERSRRWKPQELTPHTRVTSATRRRRVHLR